MSGFITKSVTDAEGIAGIEISDPTTGIRAKVNADGQLSVDVGGLNINPGDINIGAIEIKDSATDDRATVKTDGTDIALTVRQNNQPLPTGAATSAKQDTSQTTLAEIATDTDNLAGIKAGTDKIIAAPATEAKQDTGNSFLDSLDGKLPPLVSGKIPVAVSPNFGSRSDTFTATGNGTTVNRSTSPVKSFAISLKGTGGSATAWDVRLEGSLDGNNWTQLIQHTNTLDSDGATKFQLAGIATPILYFRSRCAGLTLGLAATDIVVTILGLD